MGKYNDIKNGFFDTENKTMYIMGYTTPADEYGTTIAKIKADGSIFYFDEDAKIDKFVHKQIDQIRQTLLKTKTSTVEITVNSAIRESVALFMDVYGNTTEPTNIIEKTLTVEYQNACIAIFVKNNIMSAEIINDKPIEMNMKCPITHKNDMMGIHATTGGIIDELINTYDIDVALEVNSLIVAKYKDATVLLRLCEDNELIMHHSKVVIPKIEKHIIDADKIQTGTQKIIADGNKK